MAFARLSGDNRRVITAAAAAAAPSTSAVGPAVIIVIAVILICRYCVPTYKDAKGTIPGRLLAVTLIMVVCRLLLAVKDAAAAMAIAGGTVSGIATILGAVAGIV
jgi:hypothetical protein